MIDVEIKDRQEPIEHLRMALAMAEFGVSYIQADLIFRVHNSLSKLKGKYKISDGVDLFYKWKKDWEKYAEEQQIKKER